MINVVINDVDQTPEGKGRTIVIEYHDNVGEVIKEQTISYDDLSAQEKTDWDNCKAMLESKLPA